MPQSPKVDMQLFLVAACSAIYSYWANSRRLEYTTHPLWQLVLTELCRPAFPRLWVSPQWAIYRSPNDSEETHDVLAGLEDPQPDIGSETLADPQATGVITDFAVLMPIFPPREESNRFGKPGSFLDAILYYVTPFFSKEQSWYDFLPTTRLSHFLVAVLIELKRPPTRSANNIVAYANSIQTSIEKAQHQLEDQVFCLFSSVKYALQDTAFLVAGAGEFWAFQRVSRTFVGKDHVNEIFNLDAYQGTHLSHEKRDKELDPSIDAEEESDDAPVRMSDVKFRGATYLAEKKARETERAAFVEERRRERAERADKWAQRGLPGNYADFVAGQSGPGPFTDYELGSLSWYVLRGKCTDLGLQDFKYGLRLVDKPEDFVDGKWSPILRLGTPYSQTCMDYIQAELVSAARKQAF